ncbi:GntR family transcriptional regulator [Vibrio maerlii]|uniref:GntR family transcriptional regulator n=1 Tax=Vibrio maerlii TaxID=2231648 RepID=UPI000E3E952E|nr:GntR family transcriptional regulator [Vibrio maerlii]
MSDIYTQQALPLYLQVAEDLKQAIDSGVYPASTKLPSENQLVEQLKVSRVTVRKALSHLNELGYTYAEKGKGTFVKPTKLKHDFLSMSGLSQEAVGMRTENKVVSFDVIEADGVVASKLNIEPGELVNFGSRLRYVNDAVVSYEEFYIPRTMLPNLTQQDLEGSKFELLGHHGIEMVKTHQKLKPALPSDKIQLLLEVEGDEPILINLSQNYRDEEQVYEYSVVYYKSSVYDFEITART